MSNPHSARCSRPDTVLNHHLDLACVRKWNWTKSCWPFIAWKRWRKWIYCRQSANISSSLQFSCHSSCKYSSSALSTLSPVSYPFIFSPVLYTLSFFSRYLQKFTRKFHSSVTWLVFLLYAHSARFFPVLRALASLINLTAEKWRCGLYQTHVCSIYTVQLKRLALHSQLQALAGASGGANPPTFPHRQASSSAQPCPFLLSKLLTTCSWDGVVD